jgi:gas vesicle protein
MTDRGREVAKAAALVAGGAVVGAGIALLFAPQPGAETRRQIKHYAKRAQHEANKFGRQVKVSVERTIERGKAWLPKKDEKPAIAAA